MNTENKAINVNLPLNVREYLMRDKQQQAIDTLKDEWQCDDNLAKESISAYRAEIKQRSVELGIKAMQERERVEQQQEKVKKITLIWRLVALAVFILGLLLIISYTTKK